MFRNKPLNKHFKKAQQIVELALMLPFFIICFSFVFQLMVETYAKFKFSYVFTNSVARAVEIQPVFTNRADAASFNFRRDVENSIRAAAIGIPHQGLEIDSFIFASPLVDSVNNRFKGGVNNYIAGIFITDVERIFFRSTGLEYFYFIIPINRIYFEPLILNISNENLSDFFDDWYYEVFKEVYAAGPTMSDPSGGGGSSPSSPSGDSSGSSSSGGGSEADEGEGTDPASGTSSSAWGEIETPSGTGSESPTSGTTDPIE